MLGVMLDSKLTFDRHLQSIQSSVKSKIHAFRKIKPFYTTKEWVTFARGQVYSVLYYCSSAWLTPSIQKAHIQRLTKLSNTVLRIIFGKKQISMNKLCTTIEQIPGTLK